MDYAAKQNNKISTMLSDEEKKLTSVLAEEIEHETDSKYLETLMDIDQGRISDLEEVILITNGYIYKQDHSPNDRIRILIRKIYNYLSGDNQLDTVNLINYNKDDTTTPIKQQLKKHYGLTVDRVQITGGKGQGLFLLDESNEYRIYLSGDARGDFPNDYIHLLPIPNKDKKRLDAKHVPNRQFNISDRFIDDHLIHYKKKEGTITFDQLMTEHVMLAIKELNDQGIASM